MVWQAFQYVIITAGKAHKAIIVEKLKHLGFALCAEQEAE